MDTQEFIYTMIITRSQVSQKCPERRAAVGQTEVHLHDNNYKKSGFTKVVLKEGRLLDRQKFIYTIIITRSQVSQKWS